MPDLPIPPRGLSSRHEKDLMDGADPLITVEPTDFSMIPPAEFPEHEGEAMLLPSELLEYVSSRKCDSREECDYIEQALDRYYNLDGTGYGAAWDVRHQCARLVEI